ncbi:hypothetical protein [Candidatus Nitrosocosmicus hydrocola]|uniref:hypothetical protein n=1 Tax=Candidatus Nitrosocosmicus hydrocola TaxID=1826872 RepID=UPI0011E5D90D|nr:hypothetical protein [Candidatus Nitrosocosmicus hydrocola]
MRDLVKEKERIINQHMDRIVKTNEVIINKVDKSIKDKKFNAGGEVSGFFDNIKALANIMYESNSGMNGEQRLELAKMYFTNAENIRQTLANNPHYDSLLRDIDDQIQMIKDEIKQIDIELKNVKDDEKRDELLEQRKTGLLTMSPPPQESEEKDNPQDSKKL